MAAKKIRPIRIEGNIAYVPLTKGYEAVIDAADVPLVEGRLWCADEHRRRDGSIWTVYAVRVEQRDKRKTTILMHRVLAETPVGMEADHIDGDGLNNRRSNLRNATTAQNRQNARLSIANTSGAKGVCWDKRTKKWVAQVATNGKRIQRRFSEFEKAVAWRAEESRKSHGDYARDA